MKEPGLTNMCQLQHDSFCTGLNRDITLHLFYLQERVDKHVCHVIISGYAFIVLLGSLAVFPGKTRSTRIFRLWSRTRKQCPCSQRGYKVSNSANNIQQGVLMVLTRYMERPRILDHHDGSNNVEEKIVQACCI